jgi:uncharacterized membrane protein
MNRPAAATLQTSAQAAVAVRPRLDSIDLLRGIVMVVMALDHTRDFVHHDAFRFDATDLTRTTTLLFMTRWVTHFCAPVFVFLAGVSAYLQRARGATNAELSWFLLTRGLWLVVLELTLVRVGTWFNVDYSVFFVNLQVIWVLGVSMVVLAGLVYLPLGAIAAIGVGIIVLHDTLDDVRVVGWRPDAPAVPATSILWILLHQGGSRFQLFGSSGPMVYVLYPLIPWIGVMAAGYAFGRIYDLEPSRRNRILRNTGLALMAAFIVLRATNLYGDPRPWQVQSSWIFTMLSFINTWKYPASLLFLLMTLGPALIALAWFERRPPTGAIGRALVTFGRVPLFFYLLQWPLAHGLMVALSVLAGRDIAHLFRGLPQFYTTAPPDVGFPLWSVYVCWAAVVGVLFVLCRWYAGVKRRYPLPILRYL